MEVINFNNKMQMREPGSRGLDNRLERSATGLVQNMKDNITELNRSMHSIEKMIAQSRNIISQSREKSIGNTLTAHSPRGKPAADCFPRQHPITVKKVITNRNGGGNENSDLSFRQSPKVDLIKGERVSFEENLVRFQPNTVKKEIELRRSGVREQETPDKA